MCRLYIATSSHSLDAYLRLALDYECGLELQAFSAPALMDGDWQTLLAHYRAQLQGFPHPLSLHGAFFDLAPASHDSQLVSLTEARYRLSLEIAAGLGASPVVFHTNFLPMIRSAEYREDWNWQQVAFWKELGAYAAERGVTVVLENMWDPDPYVLRDLLAAVAHPAIAACLDISHISLYRDPEGPGIDEWLQILEPYVVHVHLNNTGGRLDEHLALDADSGRIDYASVLPHIMKLDSCSGLVVEVPELSGLRSSLEFLRRVLASEAGSAKG